MHFEDPTQTSEITSGHEGPWYRGLTSYHWFVLGVAALGWLFDTMDQQLFNLARVPAITELLKVKPGDLMIGKYAGWATSVFIIGWAIGGLIFGIIGDKIGRARTMLLTILLYSIFTGLSALSQTPWDFMLYRFLTGLGVGGEFAVGVALVAEVMPDHARARALGWLQALSAVGNMTAAMIAIVLGQVEATGSIGSSWRWMFVIGTLPALLAIVIRMRLKEPDRWKAAAAKVEASGEDAIAGDAKRLGSLTDLFTDPVWRRNTIVGMLLALSGVIGLWGIGFFSFDLMRQVFRAHFEGQGLSADAVNGKLTFWTGIASLVQNGGAFFGVYAFSVITQKIGRRPTFALFFLLAAGSTAFTFWFLDSFGDVFWMLPLMGFCQIALFGGYAIYFPELFPTRLRSTGTSFCYNVGRLAAAAGPSLLSLLTSNVYGKYHTISPALPLRYAGVTMCACFLIGLATLPFAPETKDRPLPE
ncbi:MAG TPA: MFS transporter [Isosphaeraceae bacterium]|nr:MFS transporter [Isosphaeraceae bacterium]